MGQPRPRALVGGLVVLMTCGLVPSGEPQSMAEAARKERERRAKQAAAGAPAKVYTDADLPAPDPSAPAKPGPSPSPASAAPAPDDRDAADQAEASERKRLQAEWRVRFADGRRHIAEAEARCWHKVVRTVFVAGIPVQQWVNEFEESEELRQSKRELADLEEEYRRTGLPPGWVRD